MRVIMKFLVGVIGLVCASFTLFVAASLILGLRSSTSEGVERFSANATTFALLCFGLVATVACARFVFRKKRG